MQVGLMLGFERGPRRIQIVRVMRLRCIGTIRGLSGGTGVDDLDEVPESCPLPGVGLAALRRHCYSGSQS